MSQLSTIIIFLILSFHSCLILGRSIHHNKNPKTYIVMIQNELKPNNISDVKDWYNFILTKSNANSNNNNNNFLHVYNTVFQGFSTRLTTQQMSQLRVQPEVLGIFEDELYELHTTRTPHFLGLDSYHDPKGLLKDSDMGSGTVIGVLDTGIWRDSQSYNDDGLGPTPSHFKGACVGGQDFPTSFCNKKIIGVRYFSSGFRMMMLGADHNRIDIPTGEDLDTVWDHNGHGTHTSSTAAGRTRAGNNSSFFGYAKGEASGIAPKARLAIYKVCWARGCVTSDVLAGFDKAIEDGVNVISVSLGGAPRRYSIDPLAIASFAAVEKGILVSASAGNSGARLGTVANNAPWFTTVAASTIDRAFPADLKLDNGDVFTGTSLYTGNNTLPFNQTISLVHFPKDWSAEHCIPGSLDGLDVKGKIVVCAFGMYSDVEKGLTVQKAGGVGIVVTSDVTSNVTMSSKPYMIPGITIPLEESMKLLSYLTKGETKGTMYFRGTEIGKRPAPIVADFSSRGPNSQSIYVLKPDVTAPGVDILAAWPNNLAPSRLPEDPRRSEFNILSGTSMSCPHVSGVAALLKGSHPDWTPAMIRSALMTTAYKGYREGNGPEYGPQASPWGIGAGHVDPDKANNPGLVFDLSTGDYIDFLCASNYTESELKLIVKRPVSCSTVTSKPWDLNYPAIIAKLDQESVVTRTLTNVDVVASTYTVDIVQPGGASVTVNPTTVSFEAKGKKQGFSVKVTPLKNEAFVGDLKPGFITWSDGKHIVTIPLIVYKGEMM